jgi:hypothetical protein
MSTPNAILYGLHGARLLLVALLLWIPRRHPQRALLAAALLLGAIDLDLLDGRLAHWWRAGSRALWWADHLVDLVCILGAVLILGRGLSLAREAPGAVADPASAPAGGASAGGRGAWLALLALEATAGAVLYARKLTEVAGP